VFRKIGDKVSNKITNETPHKISTRVFNTFRFLTGLGFGLFILSCQHVPQKNEKPQQKAPTKSENLEQTPKIYSRHPPRKIEKSHRTTRSRKPEIYCEGDFFDYSNPEGPHLGLTVQFVYDRRKTIEMIFVDNQEQIIQRLKFHVKQSELLRHSKTHGNQTILATHPAGIRIKGFPVSKKVMTLLPLDSQQSELYGTLNFQNSKNEYVGGNQQLNCSFDL
jgi:hypothetical protein